MSQPTSASLPLQLPTPRRSLIRLLRVWGTSMFFGFVSAYTYAKFSWLLNDEQWYWMLRVQLVVLPVGGAVGVLLLPWLWYRPIHRAMRQWAAGAPVEHSACLMVYVRALELPWQAALSAFLAGVIAYVAGIAVVHWKTPLPFEEIMKTLPVMPLVGGMQSAFCYFGMTRALYPIVRWCGARLRQPLPRACVSLEAKFLTTTCVLAMAALCLLQPAAYTLGQQITEYYLDERALTQLHFTAMRAGDAADPKTRARILHEGRLGAHGYIFESDLTDGRILTPHPLGFTNIAQERFYYPDPLSWGPAGEGVWTDRVGKHRVVAFVRSPVLPRAFTSVVFPSDFSLPMREFVRFSLLVILEVLCIVILLGRYYTRGITTPLAELNAVAKHIAEHGDLSQHVPVATNDELSDVARSFNRMIEELHQSKTELEDYTKRLERSTQDLQALNQEMEDLLRVVSHDLRAPLINIQGFSKRLEPVIQQTSQILADVAAQPNGGLLKSRAEALNQEIQARCGESLRFISKSVEKMDLLLTSLLAVSRVGRKADELLPHDLDAILDDVLATFEHQLKEGAIQVIRHPLPKQIICRRNEMNQVLSNLVSNAVSYMGATGIRFIEIGGKELDDHAECYVRDTGIGIAPEDQERIFQMFTRLQTIDVPGEGVGLSYVRKIVRSHGGKMWVVSQRGQGSTFYFTLPRIPLLAG